MVVVLAAMVSFFGAAGASADAIYSYTGNDFTTASAPYTTSDFVSLTLTLSAPLPDNANLVNVVPDVVSFHVSDGVFSYTFPVEFPATLMQSPVLDFSTDATGNIIEWAVRLIAAPSNSGSTIQTFNTSTQIFDEGELLGLAFCNPSTSDCSGSNTNSPGTWTTVPAPTVVAGIPGLVAVCGGLLVWWGIRRPWGSARSKSA
jgi:hypothetical protein